MRKVLRIMKREGTTLDECLTVIRKGSEEEEYAKSIWGQL